MNTKAETQETRFDALKWLFVALLVAVAVIANQYFAATQPLLYRVLGVLVLSMAAAAISLQTAKGRSFWRLLKEARIEIRKVVWPTRQETVQTTLIVVAVVIIMGLLLWGLDSLVGWLISLIVG